MDFFIKACRRQYRQTFAIVRQAVELCPDDLWADGEEREPAFWNQTLHALLVTQAYTYASLDDIRSDLADELLAPRAAEEGEPPWTVPN